MSEFRFRKNKTDPEPTPRASLRILLIVSAAAGVLVLSLYTLFAWLKLSDLPRIGLWLVAAYLALNILLLIISAAERAAAARTTRSTELLTADVYRLFRSVIHMPYAVVNAGGTARIVNSAMQRILGIASPVCDLPLSAVCPPVTMDQLKICVRNPEDDKPRAGVLLPSPDAAVDPAAAVAEPVVRLADGRRYRVETYLLSEGAEVYYFLLFRDVNDYLDFVDKANREHIVLAYIVLDNLREVTQFVRANYRATANIIEEKLTAWVDSMNGMLREYDRDKYLAVFSEEALDECIKNGFSILDDIMRIPVGDNSFPLSVSMGIADIDGHMQACERAANAALDMALQRGGNQVALLRRGVIGFTYYGGGHKTLEGSTAISSRVSVSLLEKQLAACNDVMIMGHKDPDFDAIGAAVGTYRLCRSILTAQRRGTVPVRIVTDTACDTFRICAAHLSALPEYGTEGRADTVFVDRDTALRLVTTDTVLVIVDVSNPHIFEAPGLLERIPEKNGISPIAVIDHHRLVDKLSFTPFLDYIEATKSSTSEIIAEMLEQSAYAETLAKEEANLLLSGIMLDTHNFTRSAGVQTFAITCYLYSRNAHTGTVRDFFNERYDEHLLAAEFDAKTKLYKDIFAITWLPESHKPGPGDRIAAAKAADKLLTLRGVEASFALVLIDGRMNLSARSKGRINVQRIMEKLDGGGHFDMAGASVAASLEECLELLMTAIDDCCAEDAAQSDGK